jgi:DNA-binding NarL/FixJ family response regulator
MEEETIARITTGPRSRTMITSERGTNRPMDEVERDLVYYQFRVLIRQGMSDLQIAERTGVSNQTVFRYRKERGIPNFMERRYL